jgi:MFS transporter, FSR family, fosmidomycin resistance protein
MRMFNLKVLVILSLGHFITDLYQGALPAILPFLKDRLSLSYTMAGAILFASNFTSSMIQPVFGFFSDRRDKTIFIPLGCLCAGVGFSLLSFSSHYLAVFALVIISGLGIASFHPEGYKTVYFFTGSRMATGVSIFAVGSNLGFAVGPITALAVISHLGFSYLPLMVLFSFIFLLVFFSSWKTVNAPKVQGVQHATDTPDTHKSAYVSLALIIAVVMIRSWIQVGLMTYIPFYYIDYLKDDPFYAGQLVSVFLLGGAIGTLGGALLSDRYGHKRFLVLSLLLTTLVFPLIFFFKGLLLFIVLGVIGAILISPCTATIVMSQQLLPKHLGVVSGLMAGFAIGTGGAGVVVLGVIADYLGVQVALQSITILPFIGFVISLLIRYPVGQEIRSGAKEYARK